MKKMKILLGASALAIAGFLMVAADHIDAPDVASTSSDITDFYAFQGQNENNIAFVANVQGLLSPMATTSATFDENVLVEINIDTNNDNVEDLVIQAIPRNGKMYFFGPTAPTATGLNSIIMKDATQTVVDITAYGEIAKVTTNSNGIKAFAGPRDDPFFFDFAQYSAILAGDATSFNNPGDDTFSGTNVMSIVVEVPKSMIGGTGTINTWVESKRK
ncbi:MAG: DUF4331 family protein [Bizionia paragorgiae]|uniref:DUF4331 family protein n=1 Tax=Bizionia paragorgiae TaxID=283786 RepID=UPI003C60CCAB